MFKKPRKHDTKHLEFIRQLACVSCGDNTGVDAAHLRAQSFKYAKPSSGMQQKPDDRWTTPLCRRCHTEQHSMGEVAFWSQRGIRDPWALCMALHDNSGDHEAASQIVRQHMPALIGN